MKFQLFLQRLDKLGQVIKSARLARGLIRHRVLAGAEHRHMLSPELATVIDIGANRGQFTLAVRRWSPKARVISFEPLGGPANIFRDVFAGDDRVTLHQVAVGPESGESVIHISRREDSSSLLPISDLQDRLFPGTAEKATEVIRVEPLDSFLRPEDIIAPALLKLDVQGFEISALRGCERLLQYFDYVYAECSFLELYSGQALADEVVAYLGEQGFRLKGVYNMAYSRTGASVQGDFLFAK
jgi:FkbM family methyltransferase